MMGVLTQPSPKSQLAGAAALSASAATRLVNRLEDVACSPGSSAPTTGAASTPGSPAAGHEVLATARPVHDRALEQALAEARTRPELVELVDDVLG